MLERLIADSLLLVHLAFIVFAVFGALLGFCHGRWLLLHLPALGWALAVELLALNCPLTALENTFRQRAGEQGYLGGFIEHYVRAWIYPPGLDAHLQCQLAGGLLLLNAVIYGALWAKTRR